LITVPELVGLQQKKAETDLKNVGLAARVETEFSDTVEAGLVISASHKAGARVEEGTKVDLVVSQGIKTATIPAEGLIGQTAELAEAALLTAGLDGVVTREEVFNTTIAAGIVISLTPAGGETVPHNQAITLVVSKGPEPVDAPQLTGMTLEDAKTAAAEWELTVVESGKEYSETVPEGQIISQNPASGVSTHRGAKVSVVISLGMPYVTVPNLAYKNWDQAVAALDELGLKAAKDGLAVLGLVQRTDPEPGTEVRKGSTVTLVLV
jgi:serine/threonine-protein kinase